MSKIGKKPIFIPEGTEVKIENDLILIKGPKGQLQKKIPSEIQVKIEDGKILILAVKENKMTKSLWGTIRQLIFNMLEGVTKGFEKKLEIEGLGYKAYLQGEDLVLEVGFAKPVKIKKEEGISFSIEKNIISVKGINKEVVGQVAANIKKIRPVEPYKGKGIKYLGEIIRRKAGKKAVATK